MIKIKKYVPLLATLIIVLGIAIAGYYMVSQKKAPYDLADLHSFTFTWGVKGAALNRYDSATGNYQYVDRRDSLHKKRLLLRPNELIYIHNKINELGFWTLPEQVGADTGTGAAFYELQFTYKDRSKKLQIYSDFEEDRALLDSAMRIRLLVQTVIDEAAQRYSN